MSDDSAPRGDFTLPGEAGYETLTLRLAEAWGADTIRDSDGTELSAELLDSGRSIYSTICLVRSVNAWAKANPKKVQQNYLMSFPVEADGDSLTIRLLDGYSKDQFVVNADDDPKEWWQAFDRTTGLEVPSADWQFDDGVARIRNASRRHRYTVNFLVYRIWEEISMYNHVTNGWGERERLAAVEPAYPETRAVLLGYLEAWLVAHPRTSVVRFTSLFYNFCWFWGDDPSLRFVYADWASYDMAANPRLLRAFEAERGYRLRSEDFVNSGRYNSTHNPPTRAYRDWMDFVHSFVVDFGRECVELVHRHGKRAFVFYDDHWIGLEPYSPRFQEIGFDGIIKCVFNAFEVRLCSGVRGVATREIRLHPYLFPTGLSGEPTFAPGGDPTRDAKNYWTVARRALLQSPVDRIGLGGYPHLVEPFPDFVDCIEKLADEFRALKSLHASGAPRTAPCRVGVLTAWGALRSWSCSGHLHEHPELELLRVIEALAGLPFDVEFFSFDDLRARGVPANLDVILNAGRAGSAWSGGAEWDDPLVVERISDWVASGKGFIGVGEPSASPGGMSYFRLSSVLGVDKETGSTIARSKRLYPRPSGRHFLAADFPRASGDATSSGDANAATAFAGAVPPVAAPVGQAPRFNRETLEVFVTNAATEVVADEALSVRVAVHPYGCGRAVYFSGFDTTAACRRLLHRALHWAAREEASFPLWTSSNIETECSYFPASRTLVVVNDSELSQTTGVRDEKGELHEFSLAPRGMEIRKLK